MTTFVDVAGHLLGQTQDYVPATGVTITAPTSTTSASPSLASLTASGDASSAFNITLDFSGGGLTASQQSIFSTAASRWEKIITGDLPDVGAVDDVKIAASGKAIDGVGTILGQAGYTALRSSSYLPYMGSMSFDSADLASMESNGSLLDVITHEMGHVLGIGSLWSKKGLILGAGTTSSRFVGTNALNEYRHFIGDSSASSIPVETDGGAGTADAHWDDATFGTELMTGYLSATNKLSRMSAASLIDLGYSLVNVDASDLYTMSNALPVVGSLSSTTASLGSPVQLTLGSASDADGVGSVSFYRETNGIAGLQSTGTVAPDTLVATVNGGGTNLAALASSAGLSVGTYTYYARAVDVKGALSAVATTNVTLTDVALPTTPGAPDLADSSDTGDSSSDNLTSSRLPSFTGTATAAATVTLLVDGQAAGTATANVAGQYTISPTTALADGTHTIAVTATTVAGTSKASAGLAITVDSVGGTVTGISYDRERTRNLTVTLNDPTVASRLAASAVVLTNTTTGATFGVQTISTTGGTVVLAPVGTLTDGLYVLTLPASAARDAAGNALTADRSLTFTQISGDVNGDDIVNFGDLLALAKNYGTTGQTVSSGNVDYSDDGSVDFSDLLLLGKQYGVSLTLSGGGSTIARSSTASAFNVASLISSDSSSAISLGTTGRSRRTTTASAFLG